MLWHALEHVADVCPFVQILDAPVPQTGNQLLEVLRLLDTQMSVEEVIEVPKISLDRIPQRLVDLRFPQMVKCRPSCLLPCCSSASPNRSLTFLFLEVVFTILSILSQILVLQLHPQYRVMSLGKGFSHFLSREKSAEVARQVGANMPARQLMDAGGL